jgi:hypothetical protein
MAVSGAVLRFLSGKHLRVYQKGQMRKPEREDARGRQSLVTLAHLGHYNKCHKLTNNRIYLSQFWRLGSSRSRHRKVPFLVRAYFLGHR